MNKIPALSGLGNGAPEVSTWKALDVIVLDGADALCDCLLTLIVYQILSEVLDMIVKRYHWLIGLVFPVGFSTVI